MRIFAILIAGTIGLTSLAGCPAPEPEAPPPEEPVEPVEPEVPEEPVEPQEPAEPEEPVEPEADPPPDDVADPDAALDPVPPGAEAAEEAQPDVDADEVAEEAEEVDLADPELIARGQELWQTKICFTCHQTDPDVDPINPHPGPSFVGGIFNGEREVHVGGIDGPVETVEVDHEYFIQQVTDPQGMVVVDYGPPAMMPPQPMTEEEIIALLAYVNSLGEE